MANETRVGKSMTLDEVAELLGWSEADKAAHVRDLDNRPETDLEEAKTRIASRTQ